MRNNENVLSCQNVHGVWNAADTHTHTYMAPKSQPHWRDEIPPTTPLQRSTYIDACMAWFITEPDPAPPLTPWMASRRAPGTAAANSPDAVHESISLTSLQLHTHSSLVCCTCGAVAQAAEMSMVCNPFTHSCYVGTCRNCT